jgi:soluble lytic murein transglycosylase
MLSFCRRSCTSDLDGVNLVKDVGRTRPTKLERGQHLNGAASCHATKGWQILATTILVLAMMVWGPLVSRTAVAQISDPSAPSNSRQAFVDGIRAVQNHDYSSAIDRLQLAAARLPEVGDYALFYLGRALAGDGDLARAADAYHRLERDYPQSVLADTAGLNYARIELKLGDSAAAILAAQQVAERTSDSGVDQDARLTMSQGAYAQGRFASAYAGAQALRAIYPTGPSDAAARALAYSIVADHPGVARPWTLSSRQNEAALLVREGQLAAALAEIDRALTLGSTAELYWLRARASSGDDAGERAALLRYLALAPQGEHAAAAAKRLARLAWRVKDTATARHYFEIAARFPADAPEAMFEIGRTYEDDGDRDAARAEFLQLASRYPQSEYGGAARFRAPFMLYMERRFDPAAAEFAGARRRSTAPADRDMFGYWQARSLERGGEPAAARALYREIALSTESNYYPALAAQQLGATTAVELPAAGATDLEAGPVPSAPGAAGFHLTRIAAFRLMDLQDFEPAELRAIQHEPGLQHFVLAELRAVGAWYDAIQLSTAMAARGEIDPALAERIRYPRGFWELIDGAATNQQLDPWLVAALIRQESLYNPQARSVSDARGLMQLLPSTAVHWALAAGLSPASLDLYNPNTSVRIGTTYLKGLFGMFNNDPVKAVAAYNGGEHAVADWIAQYPGDDDQWVENIGFRETREYVKKVIGGRRLYWLLYGGKSSVGGSLPTAASPG